MNTSNINKWKNESMNYKVTPPATSWVKLESKLKQHKSEKNIRIYKYLSYAAVFVVVFGFVTILQYSFFNQSTNAYSANTHSFLITELNTEASAGIYDAKQLQTLKLAYQKMAAKG